MKTNIVCKKKSATHHSLSTLGARQSRERERAGFLLFLFSVFIPSTHKQGSNLS